MNSARLRAANLDVLITVLARFQSRTVPAPHLHLEPEVHQWAPNYLQLMPFFNCPGLFILILDFRSSYIKPPTHGKHRIWVPNELFECISPLRSAWCTKS